MAQTIISLRIDDDLLQSLKQRASQESIYTNVDVTYGDLIRSAILGIYGPPDQRLINREIIHCSGLIFKTKEAN